MNNEYDARNDLVALSRSNSLSVLMDGLGDQLDIQPKEMHHAASGHTGSVTGLALSRDGLSLFVATRAGTVQQFDTASAGRVRELRGHDAPLTGLAAAGSRLASADADGAIRLWDPLTGRCERVLRGHDGVLTCLALNAMGTLLAGGYGDGSVQVWLAETGACVSSFRAHSGAVNSLCFNEAGNLVASGGVDGAAMWDARTGRGAARYVMASMTTPRLSLQALHDGSLGFAPAVLGVHCQAGHVVTGSASGDCQLWDAASGRCVKEFDARLGEVVAVRRSPDGKTLAVSYNCSTEEKVGLWDVATARLFRKLIGHRDQVTALAWSPDSRTVFTGSEDGTAGRWQVESAARTHTFSGQVRAVFAMDLAGDRLVVAGEDRQATFYDLADARRKQACRGHSNRVLAAAYAPYGDVVATAGRDGDVILWSAQTGRLLHRLHGHDRAVRQVVFNRDGSRLLSAGEDGTVTLWDTRAGQCITSYFVVPYRLVTCVAFIRGDEQFVAGSRDGKVRRVDITTGDTVEVHENPEGVPVEALVVPEDGGSIITGDAAGMVRICPMDDLGSPQEFRAHDTRLSAMALRGDLLVTGAIDGRIRLWDPWRHERIQELSGHTDRITALRFNEDGTRLISAGRDGRVCLFDGPGHPAGRETGDPGYALSATLYSLADGGWLWTTPADGAAVDGWFYTDRPDEVIEVYECEADGAEPRTLPLDDPARRGHVSTYNSRQMVMARINRADARGAVDGFKRLVDLHTAVAGAQRSLPAPGNGPNGEVS